MILISHYSITVQSSTYNADYLEHRINAFLEAKKDWIPSKEEVDAAKAAMVNRLKQKSTSLAAEAAINWGHILKKEFDFNLRDKRIEAYEKVTPDDVRTIFRKVFFENPRRINMKIHSHAHRDDKETREKS